MLSGSYAINVNTPLGRKRGTVRLSASGDRVDADLNVAGLLREKCSGAADGDSFELAGSMENLLLGRQDYRIRGRVDGDVLAAIIEATAGSMTVTGQRI